jgi:hypothetical protein
MKESSTIKNLIIAVIVILALGFACFMYLTRTKDVSTGLLVGVPAGAATIDGDLISALSSLRNLKIETSFISDRASNLYFAWQSLVDFSKELVPQKYGRPNPFEPFPGETTQKK